jgi:hypothetical protein
MKATAAISALLCAVVLTISPRSAEAQFSTFTSFTAFNAALPVTGIDTFDDLTAQFYDTPLIRTAGPVAYLASTSGTDGFFRISEPGDPSRAWLSASNGQDAIVFNNFSSIVYGAGGAFFATDFDGNFLPGQTVRIMATNSGAAFSIDLVGTTPTSFFGIISRNGPLTSLTVSTVQTNLDLFPFPTVNNLALSSVPEPSSLALASVGAAALARAAAMRRRH